MRRAFTLIELLVVIAIIAILAAILFPVFAQAKLQAKKTASLSGLKQMVLGLDMYSNDSDDMAVFTYGYSDGSIAGDTNYYHYNTTWAGRILPYVKNNPIYFDKTIAEIPNYTQLYQDPNYAGNAYYTYTWAWITTFSLNHDGYSQQLYDGTSCINYGNYIGSTVRNLTGIDQPSSRLAIAPNRYGSIPNWGWFRFLSYYASYPVADAYASGFSWNQLLFDARKEYGLHYNGGFADGHAAKFGPEKFVKQYAFNPSQDEATSYSSWCSAMDNRQLWSFWGQFWNTQ